MSLDSKLNPSKIIHQEKKDKQEKPPFREDLMEYVPQAEEFIKKNKMIFDTISGDRSLQYKLSDQRFCFDHRNGIVYLDLKDWKWMEEKGLSEDEIRWSVYHELEHFADLREDPDGYLETFEHLEEKAEELAPEVLEIWREKHGELPEYVTREIPIEGTDKKTTFVKNFIAKELHTLYNCLDDIFVNNGVGMKVTMFNLERGVKKDKINGLYKNVLFAGQEKTDEEAEGEAYDLRNSPKARQFAYYLLRKHMVPDQEILVDEEVEQLINKQVGKIKVETIREKVERICSRVTRDGKEVHTASWRFQETTRPPHASIEKEFLNLFLKDCAEMDLPPEPEKQQGEGSEEGEQGGGDGDSEGTTIPQEGENGEPQEGEEGESGEDESGQKPDDSEGGKEGRGEPEEGGEEKPEGKKSWDNPQENNKPSPFSKEDVENFIKQSKEKEKEDEENVEEDERVKRLDPDEIREARKDEIERLKKHYDSISDEQKKAIKDWEFCENNGIDKEVMREYRQISESVEPYKKEIAAVFEKMMQNIQAQISVAWETGFKSGKLDVKTLIKKYAHYFQEEVSRFMPFEELPIYMQKEFISKLQLFPEMIRTRLVLDGSGSMSNEDETGNPRTFYVKQIAVLLLESFELAEWKINKRFKAKNPVRINTEITMYGSGAEIVKDFSDDKKYNSQQEKIDRLKAFAQINSDWGGTGSHLAWQKVDSSLNDPEYLKKLREGKIKEMAFEVTDGGADDEGLARETVSRVEDKEIITRGFQIGSPGEGDKEKFKHVWGEHGKEVDSLEKLAPFLLETLKEELKKIQFKVNQGED